MLRYGLLALALAGCALLAVAEFTTLYEIKVITVVKETETGGEHHGYALLIIAIGAGLMAFGAMMGRSLPAAIALLVMAIAAGVITMVVDFPDVDEVGLIGELYEQAQSEPKTGFYLETLGAALLLLAAVAAVVFRPAPEKPAPSDARDDA